MVPGSRSSHTRSVRPAGHRRALGGQRQSDRATQAAAATGHDRGPARRRGGRDVTGSLHAPGTAGRSTHVSSRFCSMRNIVAPPINSINRSGSMLGAPRRDRPHAAASAPRSSRPAKCASTLAFELDIGRHVGDQSTRPTTGVVNTSRVASSIIRMSAAMSQSPAEGRRAVGATGNAASCTSSALLDQRRYSADFVPARCDGRQAETSNSRFAQAVPRSRSRWPSRCADHGAARCGGALRLKGRAGLLS